MAGCCNLVAVVILGVEWILEQRTPLLLIFSLAVMFLSNYYISYMAGVFTACYFLYRYFAKTAKYSISDIGKKFLTFFLSVIAAAGLSAWLTIPTLFDLMQGKMKGTRFPENFLNFEPLKLFTKFLPGRMIPYNIMDCRLFFAAQSFLSL